MYLDKDIGKIIQSLRVEKGFTQEALSDGLCAVSTISRIENGSQMPTAGLFQNILERLGEPGLIRGCYWESGNITVLFQKREILEAYEYQDLANLEILLWKYQNSLDTYDVHEIQFFEYMRLLYWKKIRTGFDDFVREAIRILKLTRKNLDLPKDIKDLLPDGMEMLILNGIMMHLDMEGDQSLFNIIFEKLYTSANSFKHYLPTYWKTKAALMNNLAVYFLYRKEYKKALTCCDKAISLSAKEGGLLFFMKLLRTRSLANHLSGKNECAKKDMIRIKECFCLLDISEISFNEFIKQNKAILIF